MTVDVRIYKRFDPDLYALCNAGYPISRMMKEVVTSYAHCEPIFYLVDEAIPLEDQTKQHYHIHFAVSKKDAETTYMLNHIKHKLRNCFCKILMRNALVQQNVVSLFTDPALVQLHNADMSLKNPYRLQNVIPLSQIPKEKREFTFAGQTVAYENTKAWGKIQEAPCPSSSGQKSNAKNNQRHQPAVQKNPYVQSPFIQQPIQMPVMMPAYANMPYDGVVQNNAPSWMGAMQVMQGQQIPYPQPVQMVQPAAQQIQQAPVPRNVATEPVPMSVPKETEKTREDQAGNGTENEGTEEDVKPVAIGLANDDALLDMFDAL